MTSVAVLAHTGRSLGGGLRVDGRRWFAGKASCVLVGNVGTVLGGLSLFPQALPDDGKLEIGVVTANRLLARTLARSDDRC